MPFGAFVASTETVFIFKCCNLSIHALEFGAAPVSGDTFSTSPAPPSADSINSVNELLPPLCTALKLWVLPAP